MVTENKASQSKEKVFTSFMSVSREISKRDKTGTMNCKWGSTQFRFDYENGVYTRVVVSADSYAHEVLRHFEEIGKISRDTRSYLIESGLDFDEIIECLVEEEVISREEVNRLQAQGSREYIYAQVIKPRVEIVLDVVKFKDEIVLYDSIESADMLSPMQLIYEASKSLIMREELSSRGNWIERGENYDSFSSEGDAVLAVVTEKGLPLEKLFCNMYGKVQENEALLRRLVASEALKIERVEIVTDSEQASYASRESLNGKVRKVSFSDVARSVVRLCIMTAFCIAGYRLSLWFSSLHNAWSVGGGLG